MYLVQFLTVPRVALVSAVFSVISGQVKFVNVEFSVMSVISAVIKIHLFIIIACNMFSVLPLILNDNVLFTVLFDVAIVVGDVVNVARKKKRKKVSYTMNKKNVNRC